MIGAIIGDIVGSRFEFTNIKIKDFRLFTKDCFFTDDSLMTIAVGKALHKCHGKYNHLENYAIEWMQRLGRKYPDRGYGERFNKWIISDDPQPYNSYGNGAAMRISTCGIVGQSIQEVKDLTKIITGVSHDHEDSFLAAEAIAVSVFFARQGRSKKYIYDYITSNYYNLDFSLNKIRASYEFSEKAKDTAPQALVAFFESISFEDAIRNAISIGGDSDTIAAITGSIAAEYYGIPIKIKTKAKTYLDYDLKKIIRTFESSYKPKITDFEVVINDAIYYETKSFESIKNNSKPKLSILNNVKEGDVLKAIRYINDALLKSIKSRPSTITSFLKGAEKSPFYYLFNKHEDICGLYPNIKIDNVKSILDNLVKQNKASLINKDYFTNETEVELKHELDNIFSNRANAIEYIIDDLDNLGPWGGPLNGAKNISVLKSNDGFDFHCDSKEEISVIKKLSKKNYYIALRGQGLSIPYYLKSKKPKKYYPDVALLTHDHQIAIIEIKQVHMMSYYVYLVKYEALKLYCEKHGFIYTMCNREFTTYEQLKNRKINKGTYQIFYSYLNKYGCFNKTHFNLMTSGLHKNEKKRFFLDIVSIIIKDKLKNYSQFHFDIRNREKLIFSDNR